MSGGYFLCLWMALKASRHTVVNRNSHTDLKRRRKIMNEEIKNVEVLDNPEVDTETKTLTQEEVNRLIAQAKSKAKDEAKKEFDASVEERIKQAVEEAEKRSKMSAKELEELRQKDIQRKIEEKDARIAELELQNTRRELKDGAIEILSERKLPVNDRVLKLVVKDTGEATETAINDLAEIIKEIKNEFASSEPPITSGGVGTNGIETDIFKILDDAGK